MRPASFSIALALGLLLANPTVGQDAPVVLGNDRVQLEFDARTGAWVGLVDRVDESQLVTGGGRAPLVPTRRRTIDAGRLRTIAPDVVDLAGSWLYTPTPPAATVEPAFRAGRFDAVAWQPTPIPSQSGAGDDRLRDRVGTFWYRRTFDLKPGSVGREAALLIGSVDDFDVVFLNGTRIGRTGSETPHHWETARLYRFPSELLRGDGPNTLVVKLTNGSGQGGMSGPVLVGPAEPLTALVRDGDEPGGLQVERGREDGATTLTLGATSDGLHYRSTWLLDEGNSGRFRRRLRITNRTDAEQVVRTVSLQTPPLVVGTDTAVIFPGSLPVGDQPVGQIEPGDSLRPRSEEPAVVVRDRASGRAVGSWFHSEEEFSPVDVTRDGPGVRVRHTQQVIVRLRPGGSVTLGTEHFWVTRGDRGDALAGFQDIYRAIGLRAPDRGLADLRSTVIYNGHPGGPPELGYRTYGGFPAVEAYLPTLQAMGVDLLWFLPIWEHGDGLRWNLYSPFDHFRVSPLYGTEDDLLRLADQGKTRGIRLLFDLVPHGPPDVSDLAREHPEYVAQTEQGQPAYAWQQLAFDNAHPGWQDYFRRVADHDARRVGAVGARVDCAAGGPLNWNRAATDRPSHSSLFAGLGMTRAIREGFLRARPDTLIIPEEYTGATVYHRVADLTYDAQLYFLMADLQEQHATPDQWAATLARFLADQQRTLPPGALKMRWVSNHDTVSWVFQKQRPASVYGVDRMRALLALCALIEGLPMLYQGDEDPAVYGGKGPSSVAFLGAIYAARKREPPIRDGGADYESVRATGGVFSCLRSAGQAQALVLVSFNPEAVVSTITTDGPALADGPWRDVVGDEVVTLGGGRGVAMKPHQVRVLVPTKP